LVEELILAFWLKIGGDVNAQSVVSFPVGLLEWA